MRSNQVLPCSLLVLLASGFLLTVAPRLALAADARDDANNDGLTLKEPHLREPRRIVVTVNPLRAVMKSASLDVGYLFAHHHASYVSLAMAFDAGAMRRECPSVGTCGPEGPERSSTLFSGEGGYRFYSGKGQNGLFVGAFGVVSQAKRLYPTRTDAFAVYYAGVDVGGQHVFANGIVLGAGVGYQLLLNPESAEVGTDPYFAGGKGIGSNGSPRLLLSMGYAF